MTAVKSVKEPLSVGFWNSDAFVADGANNICSVTPDLKPHGPPSIRILHSVGYSYSKQHALYLKTFGNDGELCIS
jgi:hypothetical protein